MTAATPPRRPLQLLPITHAGGRSPTVCHYRCGDACSQPVPNTSANPTFREVAEHSLSRRSLFAAAAGVAVGGNVAREVLTAPSAAAGGGYPGYPGYPGGGHHAGRLRFEPIAPVPSTVDAVTVPAGYTWDVILRWGDPVVKGAPEFDFENQTAAAQALQFGYNCDFVALLPTGYRHGLLVVNHEYTNEALMFRGWTDEAAATLEQLRIAMAAHGMSVAEVRQRRAGGPWRALPGARRNRRLTMSGTPFRLTGPVAGSAHVRTTADPSGRRVIGTLNNCSGGVTPWGTVLSGEENFNQYFAAPTPPADPVAAERYRRYGVTNATGRNWYRADPRFDTVAEPNEPNRFGWIVEVDPYDPTSTPRKHTAMGRFKHEGANVIISRTGHAVAYMGDDERFDYLYKFVSRRKLRRGSSWSARRHNRTLLESGDLYVAVFEGEPSPEYDGTGRWVPLVKGGVSRVPGMTVEEVLVWTRQAGDAVGATKMDRPEDVQPSLRSGKVYAALTNNTARTEAQVDGPNPRANNRSGQVLEISERHGDHTGTVFDWKLLIVCGAPDDPSTYFSGIDPSEVSPISCPDNLAFTNDGTMLIATDGQDAIGYNDALHHVPVRGPNRGRVSQFASVPTGAETCGPCLTFDERAVLIAVQHPGDLPGASTEAPASTFPYEGLGQPRPSVIAIRREDGGRVF